MYDIDPRSDRANGPARIEPPRHQLHKIVSTPHINGYPKRLNLGELFAGREHRLAEVADKFWSKVDVYDKNDCWIWARRLGSSGYGQAVFQVGGHRVVLAAHRFAYALAHPSLAIPNGALVRRSCTERLCVNPAHLYLGDYYGYPVRTTAQALTSFEDLLP